MDGFQDVVEEVKKDGYLVNRVKTTRKELSLVEEKMHPKEPSKDADQLVQHVKLTKGGKAHELV